MAEHWATIQMVSMGVVAAACASVALVVFRSIKGKRQSTAAAVLAWFGLLAATMAAICILNANHVPPSGRFEAFKPIGTAALAVAGGAIAVVLMRIVPRAAEFQDFRNLQAAARELRLSKDRFQRAIDGSLSGLWEWNIDVGTVWYSPRFRAMLGYDAEDAFPNTLESWEAALHPDDSTRVLKALKASLHDDAYDVEYRLRTKSGQYRWFNARGLAICDPDGRAYLMSGSLQDITRRKAAEEVVRRKDAYLTQKQKMEALGELAGGAAHEFNNLLQAISGQIQFAERLLPKQSAAHEELELASSLIKQSAGFTRQLLDFSRRPSDNVDAIDPNEFVRRIAAVLRSMLDETFELKLRLSENMARVLADQNLLQQALLNLCINARDAMPTGGKMIVRTRHGQITPDRLARHPDANVGDYAVVSVTDTGCGMSAEARARIFEPFFTTKAAGAGTGLGLAVAYTVVKECGGFIDVRSSPGKGSTFAMWLPVTAQLPQAVPIKSPARPQSRLSRQATILYAEDNDIARRATTEMLGEQGHRVLVAGDGAEAVRLFDEHSLEIDLALLDVMMPGRGGGEVFKHLRNNRPELPTIFCSGYATPIGDQRILLTSPLTWLIDKPFSEDALLTLMDEALAAASERCMAIA